MIRLEDCLVTRGFVLLAAIIAANGQCIPPASPPNNTEAGPELKSVYADGEVLVYTCQEGWGYVGFRCTKRDGVFAWDRPHRDCKDQPRFDEGSIAGIIIAAFTIIVCCVFIIIATVKSKGKINGETNGELTASRPGSAKSFHSTESNKLIANGSAKLRKPTSAEEDRVTQQTTIVDSRENF